MDSKVSYNLKILVSKTDKFFPTIDIRLKLNFFKFLQTSRRPSLLYTDIKADFFLFKFFLKTILQFV